MYRAVMFQLRLLTKREKRQTPGLYTLVLLQTCCIDEGDWMQLYVVASVACTM